MIGRGWLVLAGVVITLGLGAGGGAWLAAYHYWPLLVTANDDLSKCKSARGNLEGLATEQGLQLGALIKADQRRLVRADQAVKQAADMAHEDFAAANRLQQERTGGDQCAAASSVIDKELGL